MKYEDTGFRAIYRQFCVFMLTDRIKKKIPALPGLDVADCILTYGYIDHENGLTLEVLAAGRTTQRGIRFHKGDNSARYFIGIGDAQYAEFNVVDGSQADLFAGRYATQLDRLRQYKVSEEIEDSRSLAFLDGSRDSVYIDDVLLHMTCKGLKTERCWVRISGLKDHYILGELLEEPRQDFGFHAGGLIGFGVKQMKNNKIICHCDLTPKEDEEPKLSAEDLQGGQMLLYAIKACHAASSNATNIYRVLKILRDSIVWIPGNMVLSVQDEMVLKKLTEEAEKGGDLRSMIGRTFTFQEDVRFKPDILYKEDKYYFPVFSSCEEMGEYGNGFSKVQKHFLEAITLARSNKKNLEGIVVNAFSEPFIVPQELFETIESMESGLKS